MGRSQYFSATGRVAVRKITYSDSGGAASIESRRGSNYFGSYEANDLGMLPIVFIPIFNLHIERLKGFY
jgi:hypothetical protein